MPAEGGAAVVDAVAVVRAAVDSVAERVAVADMEAVVARRQRAHHR
jgi:hypothetical protein